MNKKLINATKEEIMEAYQSNTISLIHNYRKHSLLFDYMKEDTGELKYVCTFDLQKAEAYNLGFEFRVWKSNRDRRNRLKKRISKMLGSSNAKFLTLTFNDSFFERETSEETRRRYIRRFLKEQCSEYVANVDYGDKNGREHFHAIVIPKSTRIDYAPYCDFFDGSRIYSEDILVSEKSKRSLSLYINKLTNHSLKASGRYKRLIYSRGL